MQKSKSVTKLNEWSRIFSIQNSRWESAFERRKEKLNQDKDHRMQEKETREQGAEDVVRLFSTGCIRCDCLHLWQANNARAAVVQAAWVQQRGTQELRQVGADHD